MSTVDWRSEHEFDQAYLATVLRQGTAGTRAFGLRLMWESVADLSKRLDSFYPDLDSDNARFRAAFGTPVYVHLSREDKVAQAVSLLRAEQTGLWHVNADGTERERLKAGEAPVYSAQNLSRLVTELEEHDRCWTRWFHEQGIDPLHVTYERLSTAPQATLETVLSAFGWTPCLRKLLSPEPRNWLIVRAASGQSASGRSDAGRPSDASGLSAALCRMMHASFTERLSAAARTRGFAFNSSSERRPVLCRIPISGDGAIRRRAFTALSRRPSVSAKEGCRRVSGVLLRHRVEQVLGSDRVRRCARSALRSSR